MIPFTRFMITKRWNFKKKGDKMKRDCFTLIELLIVIGVIAILAGLLMPALNKARGQANKIACRSNLRQIGLAIQNYTDDFKGVFPRVAVMKSIETDPEIPAIQEVLAQQIGGENSKVFRCPSDRGISGIVGVFTDEDEDSDEVTSTNFNYAGSNGKSDFENEGSSYEFNTWLAGRRMTNRSRSMLMHDLRPYHGPAGKIGSCNYLFADGRVDDWK